MKNHTPLQWTAYIFDNSVKFLKIVKIYKCKRLQMKAKNIRDKVMVAFPH